MICWSFCDCNEAALPSASCCQVAVWKHPWEKGGLFWCPALLTPPLAQWTLWAMLASPLGLRLRLHGGLLAWGVRGPIPQFGQWHHPRSQSLGVWFLRASGSALLPGLPSQGSLAGPGTAGASHRLGLPAEYGATLRRLPARQPVSTREHYN